MTRTVFLLALLLSGSLACSCRRGAEDAPARRNASRPDTPRDLVADGANALAEVRRFVSLGPKVAATPGAAQAATYLSRRLRDLGIEPVVDEFTDSTPGGTATFRNVIGAIEGSNSKVIILAAHYDTKSGIGERFEGANDSGSGVGLLLELARLMVSAERAGPDILFAFLDGEECAKSYGPSDGLHGSRRLAATMVRNRRSERVLGVLVLDMVADRDLNVTIPVNSDARLKRLALQAAHDTGVREAFSLAPLVILDDHVPFMKLGMPAIDIIDFHYGSKPRANDYWHTLEDSMDKLSATSLEAVGNVVLRMIHLLSSPESTPAG